MLYLPDANILIYAKMSGMPQHRVAYAWMNGALADTNATLLICETTLLAFLRITTNPKVFTPALSILEAGRFVKGLTGHPRVQFFRPGPEHFEEVAALMKKHKFAGNLTMDAHLILMALATGATIVSNDRDFRKVPYVKVIAP